MRPSVKTTQLIILASGGLYREAWRALLSAQPGISVAGAMAWPGHLAPLSQTDPPAAILLDLPDPAPELLRQVKVMMPEAGLLVLVPTLELPAIIPLLRAGATGFISRDGTVGDLARAVIAVGRGELVLPPALAARALTLMAQGQAAPGPLVEPLSERESEVLRQLAQGQTNKDIAQSLILSVRTVEAHLRSIFAKLDVRSRTEAALWAVRNGYSPQE